jgi:hypothetical protein
VDWRYDLGEDVYVIIKAPQLRIHNRKYFVPNGEWTLHPTKRGVTMSLYEWKELKKTILLFEDRRVSSAYLPPPRGTLTRKLFNAWIWSLANVTAKAFCSRSPSVRVNGMFN